VLANLDGAREGAAFGSHVVVRADADPEVVAHLLRAEEWVFEDALVRHEAPFEEGWVL
jgi:hypothetical protein